MRCRIIGTGAYLPPRVVPNEEVGRLAGVEPRRIERLFDIRERRWVRRIDSPDPEEGQRCSDLATEAARRAIEQADVDPKDIDAVIVTSTTPDVAIPSLDYLVSSKLQLRNTVGIAVQAACTGLFRASLLVESLMTAGRSKLALVVGAEAISPFFRFESSVPADQRLNTVLFADGAGAMVVVPAGDEDPGIDAITVCTTGETMRPGVMFKGMLSGTPPTAGRFAAIDYLGYHDFRLVLARGSELTKRAGQAVFERTQTSHDDYKFVLTHQATGKLREIGATIGIPPEKMPLNIDRVGNTISASILILLDELNRAGKLRAGDCLLLVTAESSTWSYAGMAVTWG